MKKQLLIAAVAATMSVQALADISITGAASATFTATDFDATSTANTNVYAQDTDITITGTSGGTTVSTTIDLSDTSNAAVGEVKMTTSLMGIDITITDDTNTSYKAGDNVEFIAVTDMMGVTLTYEDSNANRNGSIKAAMTMAGLDVSYKLGQTSQTTSVGGDMAGLTATYENVSNDGANKDTSSIIVTGSAGGVDLSVKSYTAEIAAAATMDHDSTTGKESNQGTILAATMDLGGNSVTVTSTDVGLSSSATTIADKLTIAATRALASGADLTATFTNDTTNAKSSVALKIAVSF